MSRPFRTALLALLVLAPTTSIAAPPSDSSAESTDIHGDALPPGAVARLGTVRFRHASAVVSVAFSPDGKVLASATDSGIVRLSDAKTGRILLELPKGTGRLVLFKPDGKNMICDGTEHGLTLRHASTGEVVRSFGTVPREGPVRGRDITNLCIALSSDGKTLAETAYDEIVVWDTETGKELRRLPKHNSVFRSIAFAPDGKTLVTIDNGARRTIVFWDVASGRSARQISDNVAQWTMALAYSPDGKSLATSGSDGTCLWDITTRKQQVMIKQGGSSVAFSPDGKLVSVADGYNGMDRGYIHLLDTSTGKELQTLRGHVTSVECVAFAPDANTLASGGPEGTVKLWDVSTGKELTLYDDHQCPVRSVAFSPNGELAATASSGDHSIRIWKTAGGAQVAKIDIPCDRRAWWCAESHGRSLSFGLDGKTITCDDKVIDIASGRVLVTLPCEPLALSADARLLAGVGERHNREGRVIVWDRATGRKLATLTPFDGRVSGLVQTSAVAFSPDARLLAIGLFCHDPGDRGKPKDTVYLYELATGKLLRSFRPLHRGPNCLLFSPDGELLVSYGMFEEARLWRVGDGKVFRVFVGKDEERRRQEFRQLAFSPDGRLLAIGDEEDSVVLYETRTGQVAFELHGKQGAVHALCFAPDGRTLITAGADATALIWSLMPKAEKSDPAPVELVRLWSELAAKDAREAYRATWMLAVTPERAVPFLKGHLRPDGELDERQLKKWIADLGHAQFEVREEATQRLRELGTGVEPALRKALVDQKDAERRERLEKLLAALEGEIEPALLRDLRAVQALEQMGTPAAEALLETLARGADSGPRTRDARGALLRLEGRREQAKRRPAGVRAVAPQGREPIKLYSHDGEVHAVAFTRDGKIAFSAARDSKIRRWDIAAGKELPALSGHDGRTFSLALSPDGKRLASAGADGLIRLWDVATAKQVGSLVGHKKAVFALAFSPDGKQLAAGGEDGTARVWDMEKKEERQLIRVTDGRVTTIAFAPDGRSLFTGGIGAGGNTFDGRFMPSYSPEQICEWSIETAKAVRKLDQRGSAVAMAPGGKLLIVGTMSIATVINSNEEGPLSILTGNVALIDAATGKPRLLIEGNGSIAALSADGRLLATAAGSDFHAGGKTRPERGTSAAAGALRLWDLLTGLEVLRFTGDPPTVLAFAPDGRHLLIGTRTGDVSLVDTVPPGVGAGAKPDRKALEALWTDLASVDAAVAYRAQVALGAARAEVPEFFSERMRAGPADDPGLKRLIAELDAERYVARRAAFAELSRRGAEAEPAVRAALKQTDSKLVKQRLEDLLSAPGVKVFPDPLRRLRAAQILEHLGTPEAKKVLADLPPVAEAPER